METATAKHTLLNAAKEFIRKSAGTAAVVIAPLAAVSLANQAKAQTIFGTPSLFHQSSGSANVSPSFLSGSAFAFNGSVTNAITALRLGTTGSYTTLSISGGSSVFKTLEFRGVITNAALNGGTTIPIAFDFTLAKAVGIAGNVNWHLDFQIDFDNSITVGSGTLTNSSTTFTGSSNYVTAGSTPGDGSVNYRAFLFLDYTTAMNDQLQLNMNSGSQGITLNASPIPEPSTYGAVFGLGALALAIARRLRRAAV